MNKKLTAKAAIQIQKPIEVVFESIVNPLKMSNYFLESSTGRLEANKTVEWKFPEFDAVFPITAKTIQAPDYISFDWSGGQENMLVEILLEIQADHSTVVRIKEGQMDFDDKGIEQTMRQSEGWANFLACLKAYLEYGINLRKGAFEFMKH